MKRNWSGISRILQGSGYAALVLCFLLSPFLGTHGYMSYIAAGLLPLGLLSTGAGFVLGWSDLPARTETIEEEESDEVEDADDNGEARYQTEARRIAAEPWQVVRMYASRDRGPWYLLLCLKNQLGRYEVLELSEWHRCYKDFFFLTEGETVQFTYSDEVLNTDDEEDFLVTDYLRVNPREFHTTNNVPVAEEV